MARIIGGLTTSHIPAVGNAIARELYDDPYWKPFFDGYPPVLASFPEDLKIVVLGMGGHVPPARRQARGLHQQAIRPDVHGQDRQRAGRTDQAVGLYLVREAGAQGAEFILWLAMRGALTGRVTELARNYHIPISNTGAGMLLLENA